MDFKSIVKADNLIKLLEIALLEKSYEAANLFENPINCRNYKCSITNCNRNAYASGFCNAHYMRSKNGKNMTAPIKARKRNDKCAECGEKCGAKGGWGLCQKHYKNARKTIIKETIINAMGGCCARCKIKYHHSVYDFHHIGKKDFNPSQMILNKSLDLIAKEISKCILLCANCHRLEHHEK